MQNIYHLAFHYCVGRDEAPPPGPWCYATRLKRIIEYLQREKYVILTCSEIAKKLVLGEPLPQKHASLSFDDVTKCHATMVSPILQSYGVRGTFFCNTGPLKKSDPEWPAPMKLQALIKILGAERLEKEILPKIFEGAPQMYMMDPKRFNMDGLMGSEPAEVRRIKWVMRCVPQEARLEKLSRVFKEYCGPGAELAWLRDWFMTREEVQKLHADGMDMTSHTRSHRMFSESSIRQIEEELDSALQDLQDLLPDADLGWAFGYPYGGVFPKGVRTLVSKRHATAWNYFGSMKEIPSTVYDDLSDIPRMDQKHFMPGLQ